MPDSPRQTLGAPASPPVTSRTGQDIERLEGVVRFLWQLLDNIDTADDAAKFDLAAYRRMVKRQQQRRWETGVTTDGYTLDLGGAAAPPRAMSGTPQPHEERHAPAVQGPERD